MKKVMSKNCRTLRYAQSFPRKWLRNFFYLHFTSITVNKFVLWFYNQTSR